MEHASELFGVGVGEDTPEITDDGAWPDGDRAGELLEPNFGPILSQWPGE